MKNVIHSSNFMAPHRINPEKEGGCGGGGGGGGGIVIMVAVATK